MITAWAKFGEGHRWHVIDLRTSKNRCQVSGRRVLWKGRRSPRDKDLCPNCNKTKWCLPRIKHGHHRKSKTSTEYTIWSLMKARCNNKKDHLYPWYGGRGIKVCRRWQGANGFQNFYADMGPRPPGKSIDRKKNHLHYTPKNCRWATRIEQANNKRNNVWLTFNGKRLTQSDWARRLGLIKSTIISRLRLGWSIKETLLTPARKHRVYRRRMRA
jgi:hypothetical protein